MSGTGDRSPGTTAAVAFVANAPSSLVVAVVAVVFFGGNRNCKFATWRLWTKMNWNPDTIAMPGFQTLEVTIKSCWLYSQILFGLYIVFERAWHSILTIHEDLNMLPCPVADVKSETQLFNASKVFNDMLRLGVRKFKRERTYAGLCLCSRPFEFRPCEEYDWRPWSSSTWATKWKCVHP